MARGERDEVEAAVTDHINHMRSSVSCAPSGGGLGVEGDVTMILAATPPASIPAATRTAPYGKSVDTGRQDPKDDRYTRPDTDCPVCGA